MKHNWVTEFTSHWKQQNSQSVLRQTQYRSADKSLARPGRKQARKHVRDARDFNNIETRAAIKMFFLQGKAPKEIHAILTEALAFSFLVGIRTYQHPCIKNAFPKAYKYLKKSTNRQKFNYLISQLVN